MHYSVRGRPHTVAVAWLMIAPFAAGCGDSDTPDPGGDDCTDASLDLGGEAYASRTLKTGCTYQLTSPYLLYGADVTLTIEPGVTVSGAPTARLELYDGARLVASGSATAPIHFGPQTEGGSWEGIRLSSSTVADHEVHYVVVDRAGTATEPGLDIGADGAALTVHGDPAAPVVAALDHVVVASPPGTGLRLYREGSTVAAGSSLSVHDAGGYPVVADAQNLSSLPADLDLTSTDPARRRILVLGGDDGIVLGDTLWQTQRVPIEVATSLSIGDFDSERAGSLVIEAPAEILLHHEVAIGNGTLEAVATATAAILFDSAGPGEFWAGLNFVQHDDNRTAAGSTLENVTLRHGGRDNSSVIGVFGPGGVNAIPGDCAAGPTIVGNTFELRAGSPDGSDVYCLMAPDSPNVYEGDNTFVDCAVWRRCD